MKYTVKYGDTIRMIAQRELGDAELWIDIVTLNGLSYPYISDMPSVGVATPGDDILLPVTESLEIQQETTFGTDLRLSTDKVNLTSGRGGDLSIGLDGDYELVSEVDCLRQDIAHRKITVLGTLPYHPTYGSELTTMVGSKKDANWRIKAQLEAERTVRSDPRITDVTSMSVDGDSSEVRIEYTATAKGISFKSGGEE